MTDQQQAPTLTEARTEIPPLDDPLKFVTSACYNYLPEIIRMRWCGEGYSLRFTDSGMARACQVFGWIAGLGMGGQFNADLLKFAQRAAADVCREFDYLACYGGHIVDRFTGEDKSEDGRRYDVSPSKYIVELSDDGTFGGWSVLWLAAVHPDHQAGVPADKWAMRYDELNRYTGGPSYRYAFSFNGTCLYQGPGGGENFSVSLDTTHLWSIHT